MFLSALACAQALRIEVTTSEPLDRALYLCAIDDRPADDPVASEFRKRPAADPSRAAVRDAWKGRGAALAFVVSFCDDPVVLEFPKVENDETWKSIARGLLAELAYAGALKEFQDNERAIRSALEVLGDCGFRDAWLHDAAERDEVCAGLRNTLRPLGLPAFGREASRYLRGAPDTLLRVVVLDTPGGLGLQLGGVQPSVSVAVPFHAQDPIWLVAHEMLHRYEPSQATLGLLRELRSADDFYGHAAERIQGEFHEGEEEELVEAAAMCALVESKLMTRTRALRKMKNAFYSTNTDERGEPLAAILFEERLASGKDDKKDYDTFVQGALHRGAIRAGEVKARYEEVIRPVAGSAGMVLEVHDDRCVVSRVLDGSAAAAAGLAAGDVISRIAEVDTKGLSVDDVLDALAGEVGHELPLSIDRGGEAVHFTITLR